MCAHRMLYAGAWIATLAWTCYVEGEDASLPALSVEGLPSSLHVSETYRVVYRVQWEGGQDGLTVSCPEAPSLDWATSTFSGERASREGSVNVIEYVLELQPLSVGSQTLPSLSFGLHLPTETGTEIPQTLSSEAVTLEVTPPPKTALWLGGAAGVSILVIGGVAARAYRRRRAAGSGETEAPLEGSLQELIHAARRSQLDGDFYGYYRQLIRAGELLGSEQGAALARKFERKAQEVGFQGVRPTDDDLRADLREVERLMAKMREENAA